MNERFQNVLKGQPQNIPPVWFMRQAGRYHAHYQNLKKHHTFIELCKKPDLAAEVALGPIEDFDFDVAILFSDLLFPLESLGMGLTYDPGPKLGWHLTHENINKLVPWKQALEGLRFQNEAMSLTRKRLPSHKSLIGFVGGPWTLFTYAVEGEHKGNLISAKSQNSLFLKFCDLLLPLLEANIQLQLDGGAEVVMIFDTAAGELSPLQFRQLLQPQITYLAEKFPGRLGYYSKGTTHDHLVELRRNVSFAGFGVDHRFDLAQLLPEQASGFLQGNFDQTLLFASEQEFHKSLDHYFKPFLLLTPEQRRFWVCGLGHGVLPKTPEAHVRYFVKRVREVFK